MARLSVNTRRAAAAVAGMSALVAFLSYYSNLNWFGGYDFYAMLAGLVLVMIAVPLVAPGEQKPK